MVRTSPDEKRLALAMAEHCYLDCGYSFNALAERTGFERAKIRRVVRALARKGLAEFRKGLWSDDGEPRGAGYGPTELLTEFARENGVKTKGRWF